MNEQWKNLPGYEGIYKVSDKGRIKSLARSDAKGNRLKEKIMSICTSGRYPCISLCKNGRQKTKHIHPLILLAFVGPCPEGMECCHNNGVKSDNRLTNLRWGTHSENQLDAVKHGTHVDHKGEKNAGAKLTEAEVLKIRELYKSGKWTKLKLSNKFNVSSAHIYSIICRRRWRHI
jgi:hypothetical protein